jgi:hypothetical protein
MTNDERENMLATLLQRRAAAAEAEELDVRLDEVTMAVLADATDPRPIALREGVRGLVLAFIDEQIATLRSKAAA